MINETKSVRSRELATLCIFSLIPYLSYYCARDFVTQREHRSRRWTDKNDVVTAEFLWQSRVFARMTPAGPYRIYIVANSMLNNLVHICVIVGIRAGGGEDEIIGFSKVL